MRNNLMKLLGIAGTTAVAPLIGAGAAQAIVIDNFNDDPNNSVTAGNATEFTRSGSLGGARDADNTNSDSGQLNFGKSINGTERFEFSTGSSGSTFEAFLRYDGSGDDPALNNNNLSSLDFSNQRGILFSGVAGEATLETTLFSDNGNNTISANQSFNISRNNAQDIFFSFSNDFTGDSAFSLSDVDGVEVRIQEDSGGGSNPIIARADTTSAVPFEAEGTMGVVALGAYGFYRYRKQRKQALASKS